MWECVCEGREGNHIQSQWLDCTVAVTPATCLLVQSQQLQMAQGWHP